MKKTMLLITATAALSTLSLTALADSLHINSNIAGKITVTCTGGVTNAPALLNKDVPWWTVRDTFLGANDSSTCTFYADGDELGSADVTTTGSGFNYTGTISNIVPAGSHTFSGPTNSGTTPDMVTTITIES